LPSAHFIVAELRRNAGDDLDAMKLDIYASARTRPDRFPLAAGGHG
jgi:hypothetical protein